MSLDDNRYIKLCRRIKNVKVRKIPQKKTSTAREVGKYKSDKSVCEHLG